MHFWRIDGNDSESYCDSIDALIDGLCYIHASYDVEIQVLNKYEMDLTIRGKIKYHLTRKEMNERKN